jgi:hypothetical protein
MSPRQAFIEAKLPNRQRKHTYSYRILCLLSDTLLKFFNFTYHWPESRAGADLFGSPHTSPTNQDIKIN